MGFIWAGRWQRDDKCDPLGGVVGRDDMLGSLWWDFERRRRVQIIWLGLGRVKMCENHLGVRLRKDNVMCGDHFGGTQGRDDLRGLVVL
jgi:hypothetical protein